MVDMVGGGKVHEGFYKSMKEIYTKSVKSIIKKAVDEGKPITITGHSAGSAIGTLLSRQLDMDFPNIKFDNIDIYASPRVADKAFKNLVKHLPIIRYDIEGDPVVRAFGGDYIHVGERVVFDIKAGKNTIEFNKKELEPIKLSTIDPELLKNADKHSLKTYIKYINSFLL